MEFTCIKCEFKFHKISYDMDERMCYECLYEDDEEEDVQNYGPPYSMANPTGEPIKKKKKDSKDEEWQFFSHTKSVFDFKRKKKGSLT